MPLSKDRAAVCAYCHYNDMANCQDLPECPENLRKEHEKPKCSFCHEDGHGYWDCKKLQREADRILKRGKRPAKGK